MVNEGTQMPTMATAMQLQSTQLFLRTAESTPMGTPMPTAKPRAQRPRRRELGKDCQIISRTGRPLLVDTPKEPSMIMFLG